MSPAVCLFCLNLSTWVLVYLYCFISTALNSLSGWSNGKDPEESIPLFSSGNVCHTEPGIIHTNQPLVYIVCHTLRLMLCRVLYQDKEKSEDATLSHEKISSTEKTKAKQVGIAQQLGFFFSPVLHLHVGLKV